MAKMSFEIPPIRLGLYIALVVFSFILFCLSCARIQYTTHLPSGDTLNSGKDFYDPIVVELLFTTLITMAWSIFVLVAMFKRLELRPIATFLVDIIILAFLWLFWIVGAGVATSIWGDLSWCQQFQPCRILSALLAFAWLGWITLTVLLILTVLFSVANSALHQPLHGRYDPRVSMFSARTSRV